MGKPVDKAITVAAFAKALKKARQERDAYQQAHSDLLLHAAQEGSRNAVGNQNTLLLRRLRGLMLFKVIPALRPKRDDLAREIVEMMGLAQQLPSRRRGK